MRGGTGELLTGHHVTRITGGALAGQGVPDHVDSHPFSEIDDATIDAYVATGEPLSVAGAFTLEAASAAGSSTASTATRRRSSVSVCRRSASSSRR